ncbi:MAG: iron dependent repressor, metal binding and dimerization domain protein, partial [Chloroflexota bacterium]
MSPKIENLPDGSSSQRDNLNHQAIEDYLKTIYVLADEGENERVNTSHIAEARDVKPASVTNMIQRLARLNLVDYEKHNGVKLTESGRQIALEVIRHHRLIELYLMEALGFGWDEVHEQADILEHVISEKLEERIAAALDHPTVDPHGDPIPSLEGVIVTVDMQRLATLKEGQQARVGRIVDDANSEMLRYLAGVGLT